jgi:hypothetical protein
MILRNIFTGVVVILFLWSLSIFACADEGKTVSFGVNSTPGGYVVQLNNHGTNNYAQFISVAPIVNRLRITNITNNNVVYDAHPTPGTMLYLPGGSYVVTGWSSYGTEDGSAITVTFTQTPPEQPAAKTEAPKETQVTGDGNSREPAQNSTTIYSSSPDYNYYPYPGSIAPYNKNYPSNNNPPFNNTCNKPGRPNPQPQLIWCTYCGKYHQPGGCVFTNQQNTVNDPYNPYWRGRK